MRTMTSKYLPRYTYSYFQRYFNCQNLHSCQHHDCMKTDLPITHYQPTCISSILHTNAMSQNNDGWPLWAIAYHRCLLAYVSHRLMIQTFSLDSKAQHTHTHGMRLRIRTERQRKIERCSNFSNTRLCRRRPQVASMSFHTVHPLPGRYIHGDS
jgi:hypothetical protein